MSSACKCGRPTHFNTKMSRTCCDKCLRSVVTCTCTSNVWRCVHNTERLCDECLATSRRGEGVQVWLTEETLKMLREIQ